MFDFKYLTTWVIIANRFSDDPFNVLEDWVAVGVGADDLVILRPPEWHQVFPHCPGHGVSTVMRNNSINVKIFQLLASPHLPSV